ncbi:MAG: GntR family transcriptional regulator [Agathobacter sp.]|nr:GntR family transcriptional regulator [Agathobacter sp.]
MIELNYRDAKPIYEQIMEGIRKLVVTDSLAVGEKLPSVREMASKMAINPNTISRAYKELEAEGYIYTISGKGTFVAEKKDVKEHRTKELLEKFDEVTGELIYLSVPTEELQERITSIEKGRKGA